jgi:hypothetical protein
MTHPRAIPAAASVALRSPHPAWSVARQAAGAALLGLVLVGCGWATANGDAKLLLTLAAVVGLIVLAAVRPGAFVGVMLLAAMNGIPFYDTSKVVKSHLTAQDVAIYAMVAASIAWLATGRRRNRNPLSSALSWCGAALLAWCMFTVFRTWGAGNAPFLPALKYGRDFIDFALLLLLLSRVRFDHRDIKDLVLVTGFGVSIFAFGQILTAEGLANPTYLVHAAATARVGGVERLYAGMNDLLLAGLAVGIAALALGRLGRWRGAVAAFTVLLATGFVLELTRARWIALLMSVAAVSIWLAFQAERRLAARLRRRLLVFLGVVVFLAVIASVLAPGTFSAGPIVQRLVSIFTDINSSNSQTSTFAYRQLLAHEMTTVLGSHWFAGLGLIPPSAHYFAPFPSGSIRDPDVGVLNAVMTMGVVGAGLIYLPLLTALIAGMRRMRGPVAPRHPWLNYGGQIWIVASLVSSLTLVTLFSLSGLAMSGVLIATFAQAGVSGYETAAVDEAVEGLEPARAGEANRPPVRTRPARVGRLARG